MRIQPLYLVHHLLEQVIQQRVGFLQAALETQMEQSVICIHPVIVRGILLPNPMRFNGMETGRVLCKERLHIGNLKQALVVA